MILELNAMQAFWLGHLYKANGLSPYDYLHYVFESLPTLDDDDLSTLLPWHWKDTLPA